MVTTVSALMFDPSTAIPVISAAGVWAVDPDLVTLFVSPGFARLVGINRLVLAGLPSFVIAPSSLDALEWLIDTTAQRASALLVLRHLEGVRIPALAYRVYGGGGRDKTVLRVYPLARPATSSPESLLPPTRSLVR